MVTIPPQGPVQFSVRSIIVMCHCVCARQAGSSDPEYPPHKLPTHVPTRAVIRTASYRVVRRLYNSSAAEGPAHPPLPPLTNPSQATHSVSSVSPPPAAFVPPKRFPFPHTHQHPSFVRLCILTPHQASPPPRRSSSLFTQHQASLPWPPPRQALLRWLVGVLGVED